MTGVLAMSEYQALSQQIRDLNAGLMALVGEFSGFRGEIRTGMAGMDRRVKNLESDMRRLVSDQVAQDVITPKVFRDIADFKEACSGRHEKLESSIRAIQESEVSERVERAHDSGVVAGKKKSFGAVGSALLLVAAALGWAWEHWFQKWLAGAPK